MWHFGFRTSASDLGQVQLFASRAVFSESTGYCTSFTSGIFYEPPLILSYQISSTSFFGGKRKFTFRANYSLLIKSVCMAWGDFFFFCASWVADARATNTQSCTHRCCVLKKERRVWKVKARNETQQENNTHTKKKRNTKRNLGTK